MLDDYPWYACTGQHHEQLWNCNWDNWQLSIRSLMQPFWLLGSCIKFLKITQVTIISSWWSKINQILSTQGSHARPTTKYFYKFLYRLWDTRTCLRHIARITTNICWQGICQGFSTWCFPSHRNRVRPFTQKCSFDTNDNGNSSLWIVISAQGPNLFILQYVQVGPHCRRCCQNLQPISIIIWV